MKRLLLMIASALLIATGTANAAIASGQGDAITNFQVAMSINPDSTMEVSEGITYSFNVPGHGIWRAIPLLDNLPNNKQQIYNVQLLEVLQDNAPAQYETSQDDEFLYVKIGNPDQEVTGEHTYVITYSVGGALRKLADNQVDFYWDVIGEQWDVPILSATADIWLPGKYLSTNCTFGPAGSLTKCSDTNEPDALHYTVDGLLSYEAMTVATQLPADAFTSFTEPTIRNAPDPWGDFTKSLPIGAGIGVALVAAIVIWARKRRANTVTAPIHEFVRFEIPRNLRPAEISAGWQGKVDGRAFTATLLDLAARGIITLQLDKHDDIVITRADPTREMSAWESTLLSSILDGKMTLTLKGYIKNVGEAVSIIDGDLVTRAESTGIRNAKAWQPRIPLIIGTVVMAICTVGAVTISFSAPTLGGYLVPTFALGLIAAAASIFIIPKQQTQESADFISEVLGFKRALDTEAAADRRDFVHRSNLDPVGIFATMLPYAVIFELEDSWAAQFPDITPEQLDRYGLGFVGVGSLNHGIHQATSSITHAMTAPSSSGNGSSGGSSGGGGGGGGGGGW